MRLHFWAFCQIINHQGRWHVVIWVIYWPQRWWMLKGTKSLRRCRRDGKKRQERHDKFIAEMAHFNLSVTYTGVCVSLETPTQEWSWKHHISIQRGDWNASRINGIPLNRRADFPLWCIRTCLECLLPLVMLHSWNVDRNLWRARVYSCIPSGY